MIFTAETACTSPRGLYPNYCEVRALDNGVEMNPAAQGRHVLDSAIGGYYGALYQSHSIEWVRRVGPGAHQVILQRRVSDSDLEFYVDDWTFDVQMLN